MEDLAQDLQDDLINKSVEDNEKLINSFERMSLINLAKQDKKILIQYAENKNLLKGLSDRQKERLTRKELAQLIKDTHKPKERAQAQNSAQDENILQTYQSAIVNALNGNPALLDALALKNVNSFIYSGLSDAEMTEETEKRIKLIGFFSSATYLIIKFTGGIKAWEGRAIKLFKKLKEKAKK